jgi:hypothetical protein
VLGTELLQLQPDVLLFPASRAVAPAGSTLGDAAGWVLSRPGARGSSLLLDEAAAMLLTRFIRPRSVVDAVITDAADVGLASDSTDAMSTEDLRDLLLFVSQMLTRGVLVQVGPDSEASPSRPIVPTEVERRWPYRTTLRLLTDTQLYIVDNDGVDEAAEGRAAVKVVAADAPTWVKQCLANEARILEQLADARTRVQLPRLLDRGAEGDATWLVMSVVEGVHVDRVCDSIRRPWMPEPTEAILALSCSVIDGFAELHELGIIHGDVAPGNVLVHPDTHQVGIVDFGFARLSRPGAETVPGEHHRGGITYYNDPDFARARINRHPAPAANDASDQYSVAALVFRLITGGSHLASEVIEPDVLTAIADGRRRRFSELGLPAAPALEAVLGRALAIQAEDRYPSLRAFHAAFADATTSSPRGISAPGPAADLVGTVTASLLDRDQIRRGMPAPSTSINYGSAGIAAGLIQAANLTGRADLLAGARAWAAQARRESDRVVESSWFNPAIDIVPGTVGSAALYHSAAGVHLVSALADLADGRLSGARRHAERYAGFAAADDDRHDLTTGGAGLLLGCAILVGADVTPPMLIERGDELLTRLRREFDPALRLPGCGQPYLGIAHGWAGLVHAALSWCGVRGAATPDWVVTALDGLLDLAVEDRAGLRWPVLGSGTTSWRGWCHGSAGYVGLLLTAAIALRRDELIGWAEQAGEYACDSRVQQSTGTICCGSAGAGFAALSLHRMTGAGRWVDAARRLAADATSRAGSSLMRPNSLYKGDLGPALLQLSLACPSEAGTPIFDIPTAQLGGKADDRSTVRTHIIRS